MSNPEELYQQAQLKREAAYAVKKEMGDLVNQGRIDLAEAKLQEFLALMNEVKALMKGHFRQLEQQINSRPGKRPMQVHAFMSMCCPSCPAKVGIVTCRPAAGASTLSSRKEACYHLSGKELVEGELVLQLGPHTYCGALAICSKERN